MTKEKRFSIKYLDVKSVAGIYKVISERMGEEGEPMPSFSLVNQSRLDSLVKIPQSKFFGVEQYRTFEEKAAIIFYTISKGRHIFPNGNKRMSVACLLVFLIINDYTLDVTPEELRNKALDLATSDTKDFQDIKENLSIWIGEKIISLKKHDY